MAGPSSAEEARLKRVAVAVANPAVFGEYYVRPFDENWSGQLPHLALEMLGFVAAKRPNDEVLSFEPLVPKGVLMTPPEFLKTTMVSQVYPLWLTYRHAVAGKLGALLGMLLSEEQGLAERNLSVLAWHIEHNPRLATDFIDRSGEPLVEPDPDEDKWTDSEIIVRRPGASKDATWTAKGITSQGIQGSRLLYLIGDDVVTPASSHSPAKQAYAKRIWETQVTTRVLPEGQAVIAGNFNHPHDLLTELGSRTAYALFKRPALHVPGNPAEAPENARDPRAIEALPERWPRKRLLGELADKPGRFDAIYLLRAGGAKGAALKAEWVTRITRAEIPRMERVYLLAIDPAPGAEVDPDPSFFAITAAVLTPTHLDVLESYADRSEATEQVDLLAEMVQRYERLGHVGGIGVGKIALDRYFKGAALVGHPELRPLLHEHSISQSSKIERLEHLGAYFKNGWARVLEEAWSAQTAGPDDREQEESLAEQWIALPNQRHDDRLDALDVLIREARDRGAGTQKIIVGNTKGLPPGPTDGIMERVW